MWQLFIVLIVWDGNSTYGGPIVIDGFKTEQACYAHSEKMLQSLPKGFPKDYRRDPKPSFENVECIEKEI